MTLIIMPFTQYSRNMIKAGVKTCTTRKTRYGAVGDTFLVDNVLYRITDVRRISLMRVAKDWFKEEGYLSPELFIEAWKELHPRIGYTPDRVVFLHQFEKAP
jgi:hypothetical protein